MTEQYVPITPVECSPDAAEWTDVDLDTHVASLPAGVTGVALQIENTNSSTALAVGYRKNGSTDNRMTTLSNLTHIGAYIGVDENNVFELYTAAAGTINVYIVGYFIGVVFATNATDVSTATTGEWTDIDTGNASAIGAIFEIVSGTTGHDFGLRKNGSTDNRVNQTFRRNAGSWIVGAASGICEQYIGAADVDVYLTAVITEGFVFATNATDLSLTTTDEYVDLGVLNATAVANVIEVCTTTYIAFAPRANGSAFDVYQRGNRHPCILVGCDGSGVSEGEIDTTYADFYGLGYATSSSPPVTYTRGGLLGGLGRGIGRGIGRW
jgi:hypothetical protein